MACQVNTNRTPTGPALPVRDCGEPAVALAVLPGAEEYGGRPVCETHGARYLAAGYELHEAASA